MGNLETSRARIVARLVAEGWVNLGGKEHDKFVKPGRPSIQVPRHRTLSPGVARSIARAAGWK
ncbi:MAG: type II toxin-antitoxin system HicA family toxin [Bauldia sp.]|nr:type II toxin-antitoxin system HicA family toxin [Bauldia sp.]